MRFGEVFSVFDIELVIPRGLEKEGDPGGNGAKWDSMVRNERFGISFSNCFHDQEAEFAQLRS
jgi:hypothetical protein